MVYADDNEPPFMVVIGPIRQVRKMDEKSGGTESGWLRGITFQQSAAATPKFREAGPR
jgi:hypothetical protein